MMVKESGVVMVKEIELGIGGCFVIPLEIREAMQVAPGDKLIVMYKNGKLEITTRKQLAKELRGSLATSEGRELSTELLAERKAEAKRKW
jgi:bifunctional DNA-binding transcriptional regulator/antitoxin component of YhaV-PrlF toxin-antitoxin module